MPKKAPSILPKVKRRLTKVGEQIRLARLRRNYTAQIVAERSFITRETLRKIENGNPNVTLGSYASVLHSLGLDADLEALAREDYLGRDLDDTRVLARKRASNLLKRK